FFIGRKRHREPVLCLEGILGLDRVCRYPQNFSARLGKGGSQGAERDRLLGAARGVGFGVEEDHKILALEVAKRHAVAAVSGQGEVGGFGAGGEFGGHVPSFRRFPRINVRAQYDRWGGCSRGGPVDGTFRSRSVK